MKFTATKLTATALAAVAFGLVLGAPIGEARSAHSGGDIAAGKAVAAACAACHGVDGVSQTPGVPHLAGQHAAYLLTGLTAYKEGARNDPAMTDIIARLSADDMANLAAYFAGLKPFKQAVASAATRAATAAPAETDPFAAVKEATAECAGCHGEDGNSDLPGMPALAGQHAVYLINALKSYRDGGRSDEAMKSFTEELSDRDIEDMAYYYATMTPGRAEPPAVGDPHAGRAVTAPCAGCHGEDGNGKDPKTPRLAGLDAEYLVAAVDAYKNGGRGHDAMREAVTALRSVDTKDLAAFYATKEPKAPAMRKPLSTKQWIAKCDRCHGPNGDGADSRFPVLAGQDAAYMAKALKLYHGKQRENAFMYAMSFPMTESDIEKLAKYYARQGGRQ